MESSPLPMSIYRLALFLLFHRISNNDMSISDDYALQFELEHFEVKVVHNSAFVLAWNGFLMDSELYIATFSSSYLGLEDKNVCVCTMSLDDQGLMAARTGSYHFEVERKHGCSLSYTIKIFGNNRNGEKMQK